MGHHHIIHVEMSAKDPKEAAEFYETLFGWQMQHYPDMGNYVSFSTGEGGVGGGLNPVSDDYPAGTTMLYINTDDIRRTLSQVQELGGTVVVEPYDIAGVGTSAVFEDLSGNRVALMEGYDPSASE